MKNLSLAVNLLLLLAVAFLYYKVWSDKKSGMPEEKVTKDTAAALAVTLPAAAPEVSLASIPKGMPVVFVNADSLFANYECAKKAKASGEGKVASYQKSYQEKVAAFQKEYNDYVEKAGKGGYTKEQGEAIEAGLQKKKEEIMAMEQNQEKVMGELDNSNSEIQKRIYAYLERFNKEHGYYCVFAYTKSGGGVLGVNDSLDVTRIVLSGLNAEYRANKK